MPRVSKVDEKPGTNPIMQSCMRIVYELSMICRTGCDTASYMRGRSRASIMMDGMQERRYGPTRRDLGRWPDTPRVLWKEIMRETQAVWRLSHPLLICFSVVEMNYIPSLRDTGKDRKGGGGAWRSTSLDSSERSFEMWIMYDHFPKGGTNLP